MHLLLTMTALPSSTDRATHGFPCDPSSKSFQPRGRATSSPAPIKPHSTNADTPTPSHQLSAAQLFHRTKPNLGLKPHLHNQPTPPTHTMSFLFGGRPQLSSEQKIAQAEAEIDMVSDMYSRYASPRSISSYPSPDSSIL
jgi:hypothetical protein